MMVALTDGAIELMVSYFIYWGYTNGSQVYVSKKWCQEVLELEECERFSSHIFFVIFLFVEVFILSNE